MSRREFNIGDPIAYFITWTTYGTWLPGDHRGWNRKGEDASLPPEPLFHEAAKNKMAEKPFVLTKKDRLIVDQVISDHCLVRKWELHASNVRSNHVHVVVTTPNYQPHTVATQFKAWGTKRLRSTYQKRNKFWTQGASRRWINHEEDLAAAMEYTLDFQD